MNGVYVPSSEFPNVGEKRPTALITGAARRLGRELALALARDGWNIAAHYCSSRVEAESVRRDVENCGVKCDLYQADFQTNDSIEPLIRAVFEASPDTALLVNSASLFEANKLEDTDYGFYSRMMQVNLHAPLFLAKHFASRVKAGQIINIVDTLVSNHKTKYFAYLLSKKALMNATQMTAVAYGPGIRVNAIAPGVVMVPADSSEAPFVARAQSLPLRRLGTPAEVCDAMRYLLHNTFVTGQILYVDGGENLI